jgi:hypothetical protein
VAFEPRQVRRIVRRAARRDRAGLRLNPLGRWIVRCNIPAMSRR